MTKLLFFIADIRIDNRSLHVLTNGSKHYMQMPEQWGITWDNWIEISTLLMEELVKLPNTEKAEEEEDFSHLPMPLDIDTVSAPPTETDH